MSNKALRRLVCLGTFVFLFTVRPAEATIHYKISLKNPERHSFQVTMTVPHPADGISVAIPAWNALYQVRDFAYRVRDVEASSFAESGTMGEKLSVREVDKQTWEVRPAATANSAGFSNWTIRYSILWDEPGPFNSQLNEIGRAHV